MPDDYNPFGRCPPEPGRFAAFLVDQEGHLVFATRSAFFSEDYALTYLSSVSPSHGEKYVIQIPEPTLVSKENPHV